MEQATDLLPPEILSWIMEQLRLFRQSGGHGYIDLRIQDGYILTHSAYNGHKAAGRSRYRTHATTK